MSLSCALVVFAQSYSRQICGNCSGQGGWYSPYGIVYCPACGGNGYILVPNNSVSFRSVHHVTLYDEEYGSVISVASIPSSNSISFVT